MGEVPGLERRGARADVVGDRDQRRVTRRRAGRADRDVAPGAPRGAVPRLDGRQARVGGARSDAVEPVLLAAPRTREHLRPDVLRVRGSRPRPELPAARLHRPPRRGQPRQPAPDRQPAAAAPPATPLLSDNRRPPFGTRQLVHNLEPFTLVGVADPYHTSNTRDGWIAREPDGTVSHILLNGWRSTLGDGDADTFLDQADNCPLVANPDQTDSDRDGTGDACGPTF